MPSKTYKPGTKNFPPKSKIQATSNATASHLSRRGVRCRQLPNLRTLPCQKRPNHDRIGTNQPVQQFPQRLHHRGENLLRLEVERGEFRWGIIENV
ncbi:hypothetical protein [Geitlerinema sp. PCC 9228]|uniref:hypothetical protein n=1 Tax=Geitlerinema sp. PCC 9228 TaxID=111611 RepID=UPI0008F99942|nr:hypothetical protein [Geitlerinema sp. PCC 9228]